MANGEGGMREYWPHAEGEMARRIRAHDWAATPLGPIGAWSASLKTTVGVLLALAEPVAVAWGPEFIILYNDAYVDLYGSRDQVPTLGVGVPIARSEIWDLIGPDYEHVLRSGKPVRHENRLVPLLRHGRMENILWTYSFNPVVDPTAPNDIGGVLIVAAKRQVTTDALRMSDDFQLFLSSLSEALRPLADAEAIRALSCRLLCDELQADWVVYGQIDVGGDLVDIDHGYVRNGRTLNAGVQPLSAFAWALPFYTAGKTVVVSDTGTSPQVPDADRAALAAMNMTALISAPLLKNGELVGALAVSQSAPRHWSGWQIRLVEETAGRIWEAIERARAETALRASEARLRILVAELQHRTRNLMGVVRLTASKTLQTSTSLADFGSRFQTRIDALARVQGLLSGLDEHDRVTFDQIIRAELDAMGAPDRTVTLVGPSGLRLRSGTVQMLAMAIHELATNAMKYGALAQEGANLSVEWRTSVDASTGAPRLHVEWRETGVSMPDPSLEGRRSGQGRELIERALPYQLKAKTRFEMTADGVRCTIEAPMSSSARPTSDDA